MFQILRWVSLVTRRRRAPEGLKGLVRSSSDHKIIESGPAHIRGDAVDLRIRKINGGTLSHKEIRPFARKAGLIYDPRALPKNYSDGHHHLQIPKR